MNTPAERLSISMVPPPIIEGKTKMIYRDCADPKYIFVFNKDSITAGNGARQSNIKGKGDASNKTNANVMTLLENHGIKTAFIQVIEGDVPVFYAHRCDMLPFEVLVRRRAPKGSSYLKRFPNTPEDYTFDEPLVELCLKTSDKRWGDRQLPCDDPIMIIESDGIHLHHPDTRFDADQPFMILPADDVFDATDDEWTAMMTRMKEMAQRVFVILEAAWRDAPEGGILEDFKLEFGLTGNGDMLVSDVADADSWRVTTFSGVRLSKQPWRETGDDVAMLEILRKVVEITSSFTTYTYVPATTA